MSSEKPDKPEKETSSYPLSKERENAENFINSLGNLFGEIPQKSAQVLIQWMPLGGSGGTFIYALLEQEWVIAVLTFPVMIVTVIWANYTESFIKRLGEVFKEKGRQDVDNLMSWQQQITKAFTETIRWQLAGTDDKYLKCQGKECLQLKTEGLNTFKPKLSDVFVPLELSGNLFPDSQGRLTPPVLQGFNWRRNLTQNEDIHKDLSIWYILRKAEQNPLYRSLVIISKGGLGKTTLVRHITYIYTTKNLYKQKDYNAPKLLPVLLYLRKWQNLIADKKAPDLPTLIEKHHIPNLAGGDSLELPPNWAKNHLQDGKMLVMLDGFDEVKEEWQKSVSEWISQQLKKYSNTFFILTSRPAGYHQYQAENKPQTPLFVKPLNEDLQNRFIEKWYLSWENHISQEPDPNEAQRKAAHLSQQLKPIEDEINPLSDFAKIPLLLNMIVNLDANYPQEKLPSRRTDLFRSIVRLQLGDRPLAKQVEMPLELEETQQVLQQLALLMMQENKTKIDPDLLLENLTNYLASIDESVSATNFLKKIEEVSELLLKIDDQYEFAHKNFQEYLAAAEIKRTNQQQILYANYQEQWWKDTILLYSAQLKNPTDFIGYLLNLNTDKANQLAYQCFQETTRELDPEIEVQLQSLAPTVQNARYQKLEQLLKNQQFKDADSETYNLMIETVGKEAGQLFDPEDFYTFPCEDLLWIDNLWVKYSKGKFGFSRQTKIWQELARPYIYDNNWNTFCHRVGWMKDGEYVEYKHFYEILEETTPIGHFPNDGCGGSGRLLLYFYSLAQRFVTCNI
ncbi:GUN4 domain-containing protein [Crocosphaera sp.]|uniref:GUN4 domain-containing protein n=1 Tax=Crocosphaera sp. TaxID=2729996 RepID=UPI00261FF9E9|nr:GUN4 domain-containing protein [Crocosphaera sp.]MDJ0582091.1 GUN4 domain-containing protein [Crocosphaera sp.]